MSTTRWVDKAILTVRTEGITWTKEFLLVYKIITAWMDVLYISASLPLHNFTLLNVQLIYRDLQRQRKKKAIPGGQSLFTFLFRGTLKYSVPHFFHSLKQMKACPGDPLKETWEPAQIILWYFSLFLGGNTAAVVYILRPRNKHYQIQCLRSKEVFLWVAKYKCFTNMRQWCIVSHPHPH